MKNFLHIGRLSAVATAFVFLGVMRPAGAACNNPKNWLEAPGSNVKVLIDYEQWPLNDISSESDGAYPIPLPLAILEKDRVSTLKAGAGTISYYESDGKGSWRICRIDSWASDTRLSTRPEKTAAQAISLKYRSSSERLEKLVNGYWLSTSYMYFYDSKGRIDRVSHWYFEDKIGQPEDKDCRRYDDKDRVVLAVSPSISKVCPKGEPDPRDGWQRLKYGEYRGETIRLLDMMHSGNADGSWTEKSSPFRLGPSPDAPWGSAEADSKNGVTLIFGSSLGKLDDNVANTVVDSFGRWNGSTYTFTKPPVPVSVLENADLLYQYDRRRQTYVDGQIIKLYEFFKANEHLSRHRYYMLDGFVLRHEQLDAKGKVTRVITVENWRQPRPGPKPDVNDHLLSTHEFALLAHQVYHRVYDINAAGKPVLVALSWNRALRFNPASKVPIDYAHLVYGTPDGKERWKTEAEFEKAFNTSAHAAQVFPDEQRKAP